MSETFAARRGRRARTAILVAATAIAATALLSGCGRFSDYAKVVEGNRLHERGDYQGAIVDYLGTRRGQDGAFSATVDYDVANAYARLGEYPAAAELYAQARKQGGRSIAADSWFNEGSALYERGRYEESWRAYRQALAILDPSSGAAAAARRNLELAWRAWKKSVQSPPKAAAASMRGSPEKDESEQRVLQRLETGRWHPGRGQDVAPSSSDY